MKRHRLLIGCVLALMFFCVASVALADDLVPPPWLRFVEPRSTVQEWEFLTPGDDLGNGWHGYLYPDGLNSNQYGTARAYVYGPDAIYESQDGGKWRGFDIMYAYQIPNNPGPLPFKEIHVQVTYESPVMVQPTDIFGITYPSGAVTSWTFNSIDLGGSLYQAITDLRIEPNPIWETPWMTNPFGPVWGRPEYYQLPPDAFAVRQVIVDTRCVPEPASLTLLGVAGIGLLAYGWRRRQAV